MNKICLLLLIIINSSSSFDIEREELVRNYIKGLNTKNYAIVDSLVSKDFKFTTAYGSINRKFFFENVLKGHFEYNYQFDIIGIKNYNNYTKVHILGQVDLCKYLECEPIPTEQTFYFTKDQKKINHIVLDTLPGFHTAEHELEIRFKIFDTWLRTYHPEDTLYKYNMVSKKRLKEFRNSLK
jgi:hypothetical protein